jgi:hypothetical protein
VNGLCLDVNEAEALSQVAFTFGEYLDCRQFERYVCEEWLGIRRAPPANQLEPPPVVLDRPPRPRIIHDENKKMLQRAKRDIPDCTI